MPNQVSHQNLFSKHHTGLRPTPIFKAIAERSWLHIILPVRDFKQIFRHVLQPVSIQMSPIYSTFCSLGQTQRQFPEKRVIINWECQPNLTKIMFCFYRTL